jgi:hypothetical protein
MDLSGIRFYPGGSEVLYLSSLHAGPFFSDFLNSEWTFLRNWLRKNFAVKRTNFSFKQRNWTIYVGPEAQAWCQEKPNHYIYALGDNPPERISPGPFLSLPPPLGPMAEPAR